VPYSPQSFHPPSDFSPVCLGINALCQRTSVTLSCTSFRSFQRVFLFFLSPTPSLSSFVHSFTTCLSFLKHISLRSPQPPLCSPPYPGLGNPEILIANIFSPKKFVLSSPFFNVQHLPLTGYSPHLFILCSPLPPGHNQVIKRPGPPVSFSLSLPPPPPSRFF